MQSAIRMDHLATWNEVCDALAVSSVDMFDRVRGGQACCEVAPDSRGGVKILGEELAWLALAREAMQTKSN